MTQVAFFYCNGTSTFGGFGLLDFAGTIMANVNALLGNYKPKIVEVAGLHGITESWPDVSPQSDPFCQLLDPNIFHATKINYPAAILPVSVSMDTGINNVISAITDLPAGQPFMLGGFSQGAATISGVYNELRSGSLTSKASQFLGGVCFGNPRRQVNYRGSVGGTWSGSIGAPGSTTGGHGAFPATGDYARLTGCDPDKWIEFVHPGDVFAAIGDTPTETLYVDILDQASSLGKNDILGFAWNNFDDFDDVAALVAAFSGEETFTDAAGKQFPQGGGGHVKYPFYPPEGNPDNGLTSYQIAIKFLEAKAAAWATAPIVLPSTPTSASSAGWTASLIPPAAA